MPTQYFVAVNVLIVSTLKINNNNDGEIEQQSKKRKAGVVCDGSHLVGTSLGRHPDCSTCQSGKVLPLPPSPDSKNKGSQQCCPSWARVQTANSPNKLKVVYCC